MLSNEDLLKNVKSLLDNVYEILQLFSPLMARMLELDEAKKYKKNGTFDKAAFLFGEISQLCKEIEGTPLPSATFLENLGN
ncbi:hypothetical protein LCGC14_0731350 [marine sediment metagenome]|uniref:Uncharacterized protein n=1 Tax=marine sediment metagenome TaxID=412755 RepID=A0A0F9QDK4_9ZZZZ